MSTLRLAAPARVDTVLAFCCALAVGAGATIAAGTAVTGAYYIAVAGAVVAALGVVLMVAARWIDGLTVVALSVPLPALISTADLRVAAAAPITAAVVAAWFVGFAPLRTPDALRHVRNATLLLFGVMAIATVFAASPGTSVRELSNMGVMLAFFVFALVHAADERASERMLRVLVLLAAVCGALAVLEMTGVLPGQFPRWGTPYNRAALGFGQPNALGLFLAVIAPLAVHQVRTSAGWERVLNCGVLALIVVGLFATFSRGSWLSLIAGTAALLFVGDGRLFARTMLMTVVACVVLDVVSGGMIRDTATRTLTDWVVEQRAALMLAGIMMFLAHPVLGVGPGGFATQLESVGAQIPSLWDYLPTPHNAYVQMAAETGLVGLIAYVVFLVVCFRVLVRSARAARHNGADPAEQSLRRCIVWSFGVACCAGMVVWPFSHGTGQAVLIVLAVGLARAGVRARGEAS
jgi:O-antigen ligase